MMTTVSLFKEHSMTPEYLEQLADLADPAKLWRLDWVQQRALTPELRAQLDTGLALRRYAQDQRDLLSALAQGQSWLITPLAPNLSAQRTTPTPPDHERLRPRR
jgi:hypothetical protein